MFRTRLVTTALMSFLASHAFGQSTDDKPKCEELVALFIELGERSGQTVTRDQAVAEVMSENPTDAECGMMLSLFPKQD